jgi:hypothetical protein
MLSRPARYRLFAQVVCGVTLLIASSPLYAQNNGSSQIIIRTFLPPPNDDIANASVITGTSGSSASTTVNATSETGETVHGAGHTIWFEWVAPSSGQVIVSFVSNPSQSFVIDQDSLVPWKNLSFANLNPQGATIVVTDPNLLNLTFFPQSGVSYFVQVDDEVGDASGPVTISLSQQATDPTLLASILPYARSINIAKGQPATVFATMINTSSNSYPTCQVMMPEGLPATLTFPTTDAQNKPVGSQNVPFSLGPGQSQSLFFAITPTDVLPSVDIDVVFSCVDASSNLHQVGNVIGLNTFLLNAKSIDGPDMIAIGATLTGDGIVDLPGATGSNAFSAAAINIGGPAGSMTPVIASIDDGGRNLPVSVSICQSDPTTSACINPTTPGPSATLSIAPNQTVTYSAFVTGTGNVPFDPANNRLFLRFKTTDGATVGATTVAVRTQ